MSRQTECQFLLQGAALRGRALSAGLPDGVVSPLHGAADELHEPVVVSA